MKSSTQITLALAAIGAAAVVIYLVRREKRKNMLSQVADEGYETASDILFPDKNIPGNRLHYGPVLPG